jgi:hypothetical protein
MKHYLVFKIPEEALELYDAQNGTGYKSVVHRLDNELRSLAKYEEATHINIAKMRAMIKEACDDNEVNLW